MIEILRMTASFGRLENETLTLTPGLNVLCAPNEAGKSTWAAFLCAMFYGIDTAERVKKGTLPAKLKYKPWSGRPMEGSVDLRWNGRNITIQRQSEGRIPMGRFTAYDTDTGEMLDFITGDNCGKLLLGAEMSVFTRSAFIGQSAMAVTQDAALEQKLSGLVNSGDESVSYTDTERRLRNWKNHVRHNKTGYLPETEEKLAAVEEKLLTIRRYHREDMELRSQKQHLESTLQRLAYIEKNLLASQAVQKQQNLTAAENAAAQADQALQSARNAVAALPSEEQLAQLLREMDALPIREEMAARLTVPTPPAATSAPEVFRGMTPEAAAARAAEDASRLTSTAPQSKATGLWIAAGILAAASIPVCLFVKFGFVIPAAAAILAAAALCRRTAGLRKLQRCREENEKILLPYGAASAQDIFAAAARYGESQKAYALALAEYESALASAKDEAARLQQSREALLTQVRSFAVNIYSVDHARAAVQAGLEQYQHLRRAEAALQSAESARAAVAAAVGDTGEVQAPEEDFTDLYTLPRISRELEAARQRLHSVETTLAQHHGNVEALGDPAALEAEKQALSARKAALEQRGAALAAAMEALDKANTDLRSRFSPQITQLAGQLLSRMTGNRYDAMRMEQDLTLHARQSGQAVTRELLALSGGTADQLYLALRLAVSRLTLDEGIPLVLDDALVFFDEDRLAQTMELLKEESRQRQILLFSCQRREAEYLAKNNA